MELNIKNKLFLITVAPVAALLLLFIRVEYEKYDSLKRNDKSLKSLEFKKEAAVLIHALQRERGLLSSYFIVDGQDYFRGELTRQTPLTDLAGKELFSKKRDSLALISKGLMESSHSMVKQLDTTRKQIENKLIDAEAGFLFYTNLIASLEEFTSSVGVRADGESMVSYLLSLGKLLRLQELAGQERAFVTSLLAKDDIEERDRYKIRATIREQKQEIKYIKIILEGTGYSEKLHEIQSKYVGAWLDRWLLTPQEWFEASAKRIDDINEFQEEIFSEISMKIDKNQKDLRQTLLLEFIVMTYIIFIIFFLSRHLSKTIEYSIKNLNNGINDFFKFLRFQRELPSPIEITAQDEVGAMAKNINKGMLLINDNLEQDADFINEATAIVKLMKNGDFSERPYYEPSNPNLKELKNVLDELMDLISHKIKEQTTSLERLNSSLEDKVYLQTQELQEQVDVVTKARDAALQAQVMKDEFLANMSHEIRTPLNGILGFVAILKKQIRDEKHLKYIGIMEESGKSLLSIIGDILDFSKIQSGKFTIDKHSTQSVESFCSAIMLFASKADEKHLTYLAYVDPKLPETINVDFGRIKQILLNLLSNAIKFTPEYGQVKVLVACKNSVLSVSVQDSGIGVSKANQSKIFTAFTQADGSTTRRYGGTGLGLSISSNLADLMNGELSVQSEEGKGSTFTLRLPVEILEEKPLELIKRKDIGMLRIAILNHFHESEPAIKLLKKYLNDFGVKSVLELEEYQEDGYDLLFFNPDEAYNDEILESGAPAIAIHKIDHGKPVDISHIGAVYAPFAPTSIAEALNAMDFGDIKTIDVDDIKVGRNDNAVKFEGSILVAEDNPTNQELIKLILGEHGLDVDIANDGVEAVDMFEKGAFDMVLMDENMPNLNGLDAFARIREYEKENSLSSTPIVALSARALDEDKARFLNAGMNGFVAKPIDAAALELELSKYLKRV